MVPNRSQDDNRTLRILRAAAKGQYGVLAATSFTIEHILGVVEAAERRRSPVIIQLFPWAIRFSSGILVHAAAKAAQQATVPVSVHLDHCQDPVLVRQACELPFDSIMIDMSHFSKEDNLAKTAELAAYCQQRGIATEAEPGRIEGYEDGIPDQVDVQGCFTTDQEVREFADTGVNCIAPAFGNRHGKYGPQGVQLDWDRLRKIQEVAASSNVLIALHGFDDFPDDMTKRLVAAGVSKVNVNRDVLQQYYDLLAEKVNQVPFTQVMEEGVDVVAKNMERLMDVVGSSGKA